MRRAIGLGWLMTLLVVFAWRAASELTIVARRLSATGELQDRIQRRRGDRITRALARAEASHARGEAALARVPVRVHVDQAVSIGATAGDDLDDIGLLDASMRRAARDRMTADSSGFRRSPRRSVDWVQLLADESSRAADGVVPWWSMSFGMLAAALSVVPLTRPLGDLAPGFAVAGIALAIAALLASRRS